MEEVSPQARAVRSAHRQIPAVISAKAGIHFGFLARTTELDPRLSPG
jgi:hypothetical protein